MGYRITNWHLISLLAVTSFLFLIIYVPSILAVNEKHEIGSKTWKTEPPEGKHWEFIIVSDDDKHSRVKINGKENWVSFARKGILTRMAEREYAVTWREEYPITGVLNEAGRGLELSELSYFNGMLLSVDDRSGIVYEIIDKIAIPRFILPFGSGNVTAKGMKCEWMAVKQGKLFVGSIGKEWTSPKGEIINDNPFWVKVIEKNGEIHAVNWKNNYEAMRKATSTEYPGYLIHEAALWHRRLSKWLFFPRRISQDAYNDVIDDNKGGNVLIMAHEDFSSVTPRTVGPSLGVSTMKFIPDRDDEIISIKTEEVQGGRFNSYIWIFNLDGEILMPVTLFSERHKFEGLEFQL